MHCWKTPKALSVALSYENEINVDSQGCGALNLFHRVEDFSDMPDVADDLFLMGIKCLTYAPHLLLTQQNLPTMVKCALAGMLVQVSTIAAHFMSL